MTNPRHSLFPYRSRLESSDFTRMVTIQSANLLALGMAVLQGDSAIFGVVQGLTVSASGADLNAIVAPGIGLRSGSGATSDHSDTMWIEQASAYTLSLAAHVSGANPRWVVIEIAEGEANESTVALEVFNAVTGAFDASTAAKVAGPAPVITARAGTAAANPVFPSGAAGVIPLAYVYLGAGTTAIGASDIVMCRPMLRGDVGGDQSASQRDVWGGGVSVATAGLATVLRNAGGRFAGHRARWGIQAADGTTAFTLAAPSCDGAALPVSDDVLYFYACPAPYPSGYDSSLAPREHRPGATALTRYQGMAVADVYNAVIVASTVEPQVDTPQGSPTAGNFTMTCAPFAAAATIDRTTAVYLGAASWDVSATDLLVQDVRGAWVMPENPTSLDVITAGAGTYSLWDSSAAGIASYNIMLLPVTALKVRSLIDLHDNAQNSGTVLQARVTDETLGVFAGLFGFQFSISNDAAAATAVDERRSHEFHVERGTGNITINAVTSDASDRVRFYQDAYEDAVLAAR